MMKIKKLAARLGIMNMETLRYIIAGTTTTAVNIGIFAILRRASLADERTAHAISIAIAILYAYAVNKIFVFRRKTNGLSALLTEFASFIGSRLLTMALEYWGYFVLAHLFGGRELFAKTAIQVFVFAANYAMGKAFVFRKKA